MDIVQTGRPVILINRFGEAQSVNLASALVRKGYIVVAVCLPGKKYEESAYETGCLPVVSDCRNDSENVVETLLSDQYQDWYEQNALRAGFLYIIKTIQGFSGVVHVDGCAGYSVEDINRIADKFQENPNCYVSAQRAMSNRVGTLDRFLLFCANSAYRVIHGRDISDPWSGLFALPSACVASFLELKGTGKKFLFNMQLNLQHKGVKAVSVPVSKPYAKEPGYYGKSKIFDLLRIVLVPLMFVGASLTLTVSDYLMRFLFFYILLPQQLSISLAAGFYTGAFVGYLLNRNIVFRKKNDHFSQEFVTILKYALLTTCNYFLSHFIIGYLMQALSIPYPVASVISSVILYAPNFFVQREVVFRRKRKQLA